MLKNAQEQIDEAMAEPESGAGDARSATAAELETSFRSNKARAIVLLASIEFE